MYVVLCFYYISGHCFTNKQEGVVTARIKLSQETLEKLIGGEMPIYCVENFQNMKIFLKSSNLYLCKMYMLNTLKCNVKSSYFEVEAGLTQ